MIVRLSLWGWPLGTLERDRQRYLFQYADAWLEKGFPICPSMPFSRKIFQSEKFFPVFLDAAPDAWGRRILQRAESIAASFARRRPRLLDDFDFFLRADNATREGAIEVADSITVEPGSDPWQLVAQCRDFENMPDGHDIVRSLLENGISSGGARPKCNVRIAGELWLCKCRSREDIFCVPGWEAVNLELARLAGLNVPEFHYDNQVLFIKRFDRQGQEKIPYISARTMLQAEEGSYPGIAAHCTDEDKRELFARMALNALVDNYDDHLRNHGFLYRDGTWRLSPVFDLQPVPVDRNASFHATALTDENAFSNMYNLLANPEAFLLDAKDATNIILNIQEIIHSNIKYLSKKYDVADERDVFISYTKLDNMQQIFYAPGNG